MTTILLLDDNPVVRQLLGLFLRARGGYRVLEAGTLQEAIAQSDPRTGEVDLLIADVCIGDEAGRALADRLTTLYPHLRVLFMSGYSKDHLVGNGLLEPADAFLAKPFAADTLVRRVAEVLGGSCEAHIPRVPRGSISGRPQQLAAG